MEFSRKKITNEAIYAEEKKLAAEISAIAEEYEGKFSELGYVLEKEFTRDNDSMGATPEEREEVRTSNLEESAGIYESGYSSIVKITVKREKSEEDIAVEEAEAEEPAEDISEEERELRENERTLEKAKREQERSVAFTTMMLVRVYKTFWKETVSISENADEIRADMEEFYSVLYEKANNTEAEEAVETEAE